MDRIFIEFTQTSNGSKLLISRKKKQGKPEKIIKTGPEAISELKKFVADL